MRAPTRTTLAAAALALLACNGDIGEKPTGFKEDIATGAGAGSIASSANGAGPGPGAGPGAGGASTVGSGPSGATTGAGADGGAGGTSTASTSTATSTAASSAASTAASSASSAAASSSTSGSGGATGACGVFPADNWWNTDISNAPLDPLSDTYVASIGTNSPFHPDFGTVYGIPYVLVDSSVQKLSVSFQYASESDPGPYPIPPNPPVEAGGDAHILMVHTDECVLYELFAASYSGGMWHAGSGAIWDLATNSTRPPGWTSADAAGLPIYPGLARYEEAVVDGAIHHALRFTAPSTQAAYVAPASHHAGSNNPNLPPMGLHMRLKASVNISGFPPSAQVIATALKKYGMFLADNGSSWFVSGAPNPSWDDNELDALKSLHGSDFEAIQTGPLIQ